ncbi:MAG: hypothetical protein JNK94_08170 [Hyphomonadaceae bacterium]|nr:hypothetical protein [Hyphomonadaceae bacterium]MBX3511375.1 hypothetical protein [Hyphomonadaceae bacterium]
MRRLAAVLALAALGACGEVNEVDGGKGADGAPASGYTLEVRADPGQQTYLITTPEGRTVGARAAEGASMMMDERRASALFADPPSFAASAPEVMALRLPGFDLSIGAEEENAEGDNGRVHLSLGRAGQGVQVFADEGGPGDEDDRAYVRISGADEATVRDFISDADKLSADVRAEMLAALGLSTP